jgi:hypothetical protein
LKRKFHGVGDCVLLVSHSSDISWSQLILHYWYITWNLFPSGNLSFFHWDFWLEGWDLKKKIHGVGDSVFLVSSAFQILLGPH